MEQSLNAKGHHYFGFVTLDHALDHFISKQLITQNLDKRLGPIELIESLSLLSRYSNSYSVSQKIGLDRSNESRKTNGERKKLITLLGIRNGK